MKSMCHDARRNSPSVTLMSPASRCIATTSRIASFSAPRSSESSIRPAACSSRAFSSEAGLSRLPTWSARKGGLSRIAMACTLSGRVAPTASRALTMSYVDPPRLHFAGKFEAAVSTVNNDVFHFDSAHFKPEYKQLQPPGSRNGGFNPRGDAAFRLIGCEVTGAYGPGGRAAGADPVFGCAVADSDRRPPAKLADLDPQQQLVSTIFGLEVRICDRDGVNLVRGSYEPAAFIDIWDRAAGAGSDTNAGSVYQSVLTDLEWGDVSGSRFMTALKEAAADGLLSIKFNVDGFNMDFGGPDFMRGRIVGTIGPARAGEPHQLLLGRRLLAVGDPSGNFFKPVGGINFCTAVVDEAAATVRVDLGNALPTVDPGGDLVPGRGFGAVALAYLDPAPVLLGTIPYSHVGWYQSTAAITDVKVSAEQLTALRERPLAIVRRLPSGSPSAPPSWQVAVQEAGSGLHVRADRFVLRLDPRETETVRAHATRFGRPFEGRVDVALNPGGLQGPTERHPDDPPGPLPPLVATPVGSFPSALDFPEQVTSDANGLALVEVK